MGVRVEKMEKLLSETLGYSVWISKRTRGYEVQKVANGNYLTDSMGENLVFKTLNDIKGYIEELEERNEWKKEGLKNA